jgi:Malectin domain
MQGNEVQKDFNIVDAANGSYAVVTRKYENVIVRNRTVDIHFQWAGRGTCCIPYEYTYGPLVSAIRVSKGTVFSCLN